MKYYQRFRMAAKGAASGWKGIGYNFSSWMGRTFWGIDNSKLATNETIFKVYYSERGVKSQLKKFETEEDTCEDFYLRISRFLNL